MDMKREVGVTRVMGKQPLTQSVDILRRVKRLAILLRLVPRPKVAWRMLALGVMFTGLLVLAPGSAQARGGALDQGFGMDGVVVDNGLEGAGALLLQPDGKIFVAGWCCGNKEEPEEFRAVRYKPDGSPDFYSGPYDSYTFGRSAATTVALQPDGKIVVAGDEYPGSGFLTRFNTDGSVDASFGTDGISTVSTISPSALLMQPGGKLLLVGTYAGDPFSVPYDPRLALARFNADGSLDSTFGTKGVVTSTFGGSDFAVTAAEQEGKILVAGFAGYVTSDGGSYDQGIVVRYQADGSLDTGFAQHGLLYGITPVHPSMAVLGDGKFLVGGGFGIDRFNADGSYDPTFKGAPGDYPSALIALAPDGSIVGASGNKIARYHADGSIDLDFGRFAPGSKPGVVTVPNFGASGVAVQRDGTIVVVGSSPHRDLVVARLLPDRSELLHVRRRGTARGTVISNPPGIRCTRKHGTCMQLFEQGTTVTLTVQNAHGSRVRWSGACKGRKRTCSVTMTGNRTVVAKFASKSL
jgi:uncharacterized delta-60 repeat protein